MVVGWQERCTIQAVEDLVSRRSMQIRYDEGNGAYHLIDMKNANGMCINGRKFESDIALRDNDEIEIDAPKLIFSKTYRANPERQRLPVFPEQVRGSRRVHQS